MCDELARAYAEGRQRKEAEAAELIQKIRVAKAAIEAAKKSGDVPSYEELRFLERRLEAARYMGD